MPTIDWTSPRSYATGAATLDRVIAEAASRRVHLAFASVSGLLELAREIDDVESLQNGVERSQEAMAAFIAVHDELDALRRGDAPVRIVPALKRICEAHIGIPGVEGSIRFEANERHLVALAGPGAAWATAAVLCDMIRELSRRGPVRVGVSAGTSGLTIRATAPTDARPRNPRGLRSDALQRRLVALLDAQLVRQHVVRRAVICLHIPAVRRPQGGRPM